jgi:hypothetical protein
MAIPMAFVLVFILLQQLNVKSKNVLGSSICQGQRNAYP